MGFFDSKKKTTNNNVTNDYTTTTVDNRYSELDLSEGSVGITGDVSGSVTVNSTDYGAMASAQQLAMGAFDFGADALEQGAGLGVEALAVGRDGLQIGADLGVEGLGVASDVFSMATGLSSEALGVGRDSLQMGFDSLDTVHGLASETIGFSQNALSQTIEQINANASETIDQIVDSAETFAQLTQRSLETTQTAYNQANTSEAGQLSQKTILYLAIVVGLWVLSPVLKKLF
ncbi:hypothetical protein ACJJI5_12370 [Microbulbifer sp. EKSA008]|uniref:hypothetical protein n=1 Tax=Microbulbifer sp. EKSA008 TaxID=3243367 RepID=UPI004042207D